MKKFVLSISFLFILMGILILQGWRFNKTASFPLGLYKLTDTPSQRGDLVLFCLPASPLVKQAQQRGYLGIGCCGHNSGYLIKKIVAIFPDIISITKNGVSVNKKLIANSQPLAKDNRGQSLVPYLCTDYPLKRNEVLLMSDYSPKSFDARYFGPITAKHICGVVQPVWVWR